MTQDLLIEIGTEELPPGALLDLSDAFTQGLVQLFTEGGIAFHTTEAFCTPRRLATLLTGVAMKQVDQMVFRRGPAVATAFTKDGLPTKAAEGFARSCGVTVSELDREVTEKGEWLSFHSVLPGRETASLVPEIVERVLDSLPIPKRMRWGYGEAEFVRPIHWICLVLGDQWVPGEILGLATGNVTFGHRFHAPDPLTLTHATLYPELLLTHGHVVPSFAQRRARIATEVSQLAQERGLKAELPPALLDEVTALVEWPRAIICTFDEAFLVVPEEVLVETMQKHQKYFPLRNRAGRLASSFITVSNIDSADPEQVRQGNERVIRPRFADAKFFWEQDRKRSLENRFSALEDIVFQEKLGSVADRSRRIQRVAGRIASTLGRSQEDVVRAALLAKCDLVSAMVGEFPSLQGIMGRYYAEHSGEPDAVCVAIEEHYLPRVAGGPLPRSDSGRILALADRLDLLVGVFGVGLRPTGTKDPYGLRRASIAIIRILLESRLDLDLSELLRWAEKEYSGVSLAPETSDSVLSYVADRLRGYYQEQGIAPDTVEAALCTGSKRLIELDARIQALHGFRYQQSGIALASANKRLKNILSKSPPGLARRPEGPDPSLFEIDAERELWQRIVLLEQTIPALTDQRKFTQALTCLAESHEAVDRFFEDVMIMTEDDSVRTNRLVLLQRLAALFSGIGDLSVLQSPAETNSTHPVH